jgi:DNA-binding transcriptional LysR family regulator
MARSEWLRTFVAIYRSSSVTDGASRMNVSQPAASQQLASLERSIGAPLFLRTPGGVKPTQRGSELYAQVAEPLDRLESVLRGLEQGNLAPDDPPIRFGSSAEFFASEMLGLVAGSALAISAHFGDDAELFAMLRSGELDLVVCSQTPPRRSMGAEALGSKRFVLIGAPELLADGTPGSVAELGGWLQGRPWVSYSLELPITRRFWATVLGRSFSAELRIVAPDLRAVLHAVELGMGVSLLPTFVCAQALQSGRVNEIWPVSDLVPAEPWFVCTRQGEMPRENVRLVLDLLRSYACNRD